GERKPKLPASQPPVTDPRTFGPRPSSTGTAVSWHAYASMRTRTRLMNLPCRYSQAKSSLHRPCPSGEDVAARITRTVDNTPPPPFNPAGCGATEPIDGAERVRAGTRPGRSVDMPN